ncbi:hypothetical protein RvY_11445 [Ramazzottius varieornatus]|uniref:Transporter n=1 Tax=Ramazzottius varieornatus TaxID=947166 RepID=A0A1D1VG69_RAMVA|nr:hypothetical protein RvY_11445 [Ramazzottius varieornatus]
MMVTLRAVVLHEPLPWSWCDPQWANNDCFDRSSSNESSAMVNSTGEKSWIMLSSMASNVSWLFVNESAISTDSVHWVNTSRQQPSPEQYFENQVLQIRLNGTEYTIDHLGGIVWPLAVCVLACWTMVCLGLIKGVESAGKVVYVTATLPYVILFALMIRGATLDGAKGGMIFLFTPQWSKLIDITTWRNAASQCFYGISVTNGSLITFGSYNPFRHKVAKDALAVCILDTVASLMACVGIFAVLGHLSLQLGVPIESVSKGGQGLAFAVYPEALQLLPAPHLWAVLFFLMLFSLGIDSLFGSVEPILTSLFDQFPRQRQHKAKWTIGFCAAFFLLTLPCVTHGGLYVIDLLDTYGGGISLLIIATSESLAVFWMYGVDRLAQDFLFMMAYKSSVILKICWKYITPILIACILLASLLTHQPISASGKPYPAWADGLGWTLVFAIVLPIPTWAICTVVHRLLLRHHKEPIKPIVDGLMGPGAKWGPADDVVWQEREQFRLVDACDRQLKKSTETSKCDDGVGKF